MKQLRQYIWSAVWWPALAVLSVLVSLDCLFSFIRELEFLRGQYQALQALQFVLTTLPRRIHEFLPMAVLLGTLLGLGVLANNGELTIIRSAGVSTWKIARMALRPVLTLILVGLLTGEYLAPYTEQIAQSNRALAEGQGPLRSKFGYWHREGAEFIHITAVQPNGVLYGVQRYRFNPDRSLAETQYIGRAIYQRDYWFLEEVRGTEFLTGGHLRTYQHPTGEWHTKLTPQLLSLVVLQPEHLGVAKLYQYSTYLKRQGLDAAEYMLALWQKVMQPLATIGMVLIAISFIFGPLRSVTMGLRLTAGVVAGLVFHYGQQFFGHLSLVFDASAPMAASVPVLICLLAGVWLMRRVY